MSYAEPKAVAILEAHGLHHAHAIFRAARAAELPLPGAAALMEKESSGRNVYGHDEGGALSGFPEEVNRDNFAVFWWLVDEKGMPSNGVGPAQITFRGFFPQMRGRGLLPWVPLDNMTFGFGILKGYLDAQSGTRLWRVAGTRYNGSAAYGDDLAEKVQLWRERLQPARLTRDA